MPKKKTAREAAKAHIDAPEAAEAVVENEEAEASDIDDIPEVEVVDGDETEVESLEELAPLVLAPGKKGGPAEPLSLYLREISRFPLLEPEEEYELAKRVQESDDPDAAFRLVSSHLRLVVKIAMDFQRRWMQNVLDLIQEGNVGLMRAVQKFDPEKGIKFSYYASFWIKAYILKFIMDNWRLVKIGTTQTQRKLFYNLNKERQRLTSLGFDATTKALSENLNVPKEQIREMAQRLDNSDMSLDIKVGEDSTASRLDFLAAEEPGIEEAYGERQVADILREHIAAMQDELTDKERDILNFRLLTDQPLTLREIGEKYGITRERVRQLETRLLKKLKESLAKDMDDFSEEWITPR